MKNKDITIQNYAYECWYINKYCVHCYGQDGTRSKSTRIQNPPDQNPPDQNPLV